jgi:type II secretory pathway component PulJ
MIWLLALLLVASVDLEVRHATLARRTAQQAEVLQVAVRQHAPDLARLSNEELLATLSRRVEAAREAARRSPVLLLTTLGRLAGPLQEQPGMEIRAVGFEEGVLTLEGQAGSAQQAEAFRSSLGAVLDKPELVENRAGAGGQTRFRLEGQVRQP